MGKNGDAWKAFERRIASVFGGKRRGAHAGTGVKGEGLSDIIHEHFSVECKLLGAPTYSAMLDACKQAEAAAEPGQEPVAVVKRKNKQDKDALVIYRLETFGQWRLPMDWRNVRRGDDD